MFLKHEPCPNCGSRDNLARYSDGGAYCFGCHYHERSTQVANRSEEVVKRTTKPLPEDIGYEFSKECVEWLRSFHVDIPTAIRNGLVWSPSREQLIYKLGEVWQARNFNKEAKEKRKNFTSGNVNDCLFIYGNGGRTLCLSEDPLSALRIGSQIDCMPLLGSHLATSRLNAVARLYSRLIVWLDSDKWNEAKAIANRAKLLGMETRAVFTVLDPKCYTDMEIKEILK